MPDPGANFALVYSGLGEKETAWTWLKQAWDERAWLTDEMGMDPQLSVRALVYVNVRIVLCFLHMRTTILLPDTLYRETKAAAAAAGRTVTSLIEDALRERLARRAPSGKKPRRARLPVSHGTKGLRPGVDLDDSAALLDAMEGRE